MKTYKIEDKHGACRAFEIENAYVSPRRVAALLTACKDVTDVRVRKLFSSFDSIHVRFRYSDHEFVVCEPFGDNSRYWIGPAEDSDVSPSLEDVRRVFEAYVPPLAKRMLGDLVTLKFISHGKASR